MPLKISEPSSNYKGEVESETYGRGSALLRNDRFYFDSVTWGFIIFRQTYDYIMVSF